MRSSTLFVLCKCFLLSVPTSFLSTRLSESDSIDISKVSNELCLESCWITNVSKVTQFHFIFLTFEFKKLISSSDELVACGCCCSLLVEITVVSQICLFDKICSYLSQGIHIINKTPAISQKTTETRHKPHEFKKKLTARLEYCQQ